MPRFYRRRGFRRRYRKRNIFRRKVSRMMRQSDYTRMILNAPNRVITLNMSRDFCPSNITESIASPVYIIDPVLYLIGGKSSLSGSEVTIFKDATFTGFANLFDEFKINAIRVKIQVYQAPAPAGQNVNGANFIRYALDLNGFSDEANDYTGLQSIIFHSPKNGHQFPDFITSYSSYNQQTMNATALYPIYQTFYPRGQSKGMWLGTSWNFGTTASHNPRLDFNFKPVIMFQILAPLLSTNASQTAIFSLDIDYDITFKGQRRPQISQ